MLDVGTCHDVASGHVGSPSCQAACHLACLLASPLAFLLAVSTCHRQMHRRRAASVGTDPDAHGLAPPSVCRQGSSTIGVFHSSKEGEACSTTHVVHMDERARQTKAARVCVWVRSTAES